MLAGALAFSGALGAAVLFERGGELVSGALAGVVGVGVGALAVFARGGEAGFELRGGSEDRRVAMVVRPPGKVLGDFASRLMREQALQPRIRGCTSYAVSDRRRQRTRLR